MVDLLQASFKATAVISIIMVWAKITIEAFNFSWQKKYLGSLSEKSCVKNAVSFFRMMGMNWNMESFM